MGNVYNLCIESNCHDSHADGLERHGPSYD
jgi:hypothetical protein